METKFNTIEIICSVAEQSNDCKLSNSHLSEINPLLLQLSGKLGVSPMQSFWISIMYMFSFKNSTVDFDDIARYLDCNILKVLPYQNDFMELSDKRIFNRIENRSYGQVTGFNFSLNQQTIQRIAKNERLEFANKEPIVENAIDFLEQINSNFDKQDKDDLNAFLTLEIAMELIDKYAHISYVSKVINLHFDNHDTNLFFLICWECISGNESTSLLNVLKKIYPTKSSQYREFQNIINKKSNIIKHDWIELKPERFCNDIEVCLSEKAITFLDTEGIKLFDSDIDKKDLLLSKNIAKKKLLLNESEQIQYQMIESAIHPSNHVRIQEHLTKKRLTKGITVLLHGHPGTGKTETVLQMAKASGRDLFKVDISETKSAWFGESQKIIKQIFIKYNKIRKNSKVCPILFINEADALFSKRKNSNMSSVAQTENEIQNIILEELENFEGILFATTNIIDNFDKAFDRRFLFKLLLPKPDVTLRSSLWKSKIKKLKATECKLLAEKFEFSGGEIDNVVKKIEISKILNSKPITISNIIQYCENESMRKNTFVSKIGY